MKNKATRILSMLLAVIMIVGIMPLSVFAANTPMTVNVESVKP